jgi:hypothetical protein
MIFLPCHRPKSNGTSWPCTEIPETVNRIPGYLRNFVTVMRKRWLTQKCLQCSEGMPLLYTLPTEACICICDYIIMELQFHTKKKYPLMSYSSEVNIPFLITFSWSLKQAVAMHCFVWFLLHTLIHQQKLTPALLNFVLTATFWVVRI